MLGISWGKVVIRKKKRKKEKKQKKEKKERNHDADVVADGRGRATTVDVAKPNQRPKRKMEQSSLDNVRIIAGKKRTSGISSPWSQAAWDRQVAATDGDLKERHAQELSSTTNTIAVPIEFRNGEQNIGRADRWKVWTRDSESFAHRRATSTGAIPRKPNWDIASQAQQESGIGGNWGFSWVDRLVSVSPPPTQSVTSWAYSRNRNTAATNAQEFLSQPSNVDEEKHAVVVEKALALASNIDVVVNEDLKAFAGEGIKVQLERTSRAQDQSHTLYHVRISYGPGAGNSWEVSRRYNEFLRLHDSLKAKVSRLPKFPGKRYLGSSMSSRFVEERRKALLSYLIELVSMPKVWDGSELIAFLDNRKQQLRSHVESYGFKEKLAQLSKACRDAQKLLRKCADSLQEQSKIEAEQEELVKWLRNEIRNKSTSSTVSSASTVSNNMQHSSVRNVEIDRTISKEVDEPRTTLTGKPLRKRSQSQRPATALRQGILDYQYSSRRISFGLSSLRRRKEKRMTRWKRQAQTMETCGLRQILMPFHQSQHLVSASASVLVLVLRWPAPAQEARR